MLQSAEWKIRIYACETLDSNSPGYFWLDYYVLGEFRHVSSSKRLIIQYRIYRAQLSPLYDWSPTVFHCVTTISRRVVWPFENSQLSTPSNIQSKNTTVTTLCVFKTFLPLKYQNLKSQVSRSPRSYL